MKYNLFIAYDLNNDPDSANYKTLTDAIGELGKACSIQKSLWFVCSEYGAEEAKNRLKKSIKYNDYLVVIEANHAAWTDVQEYASEMLHAHLAGNHR